MNIQRIVIWGHKLHSNTFSYVHASFYKTFIHLGYKVHWFDNDDNVSNFDFANSLFLTEGQVLQKMPIRSDCFYLLHNADNTIHQQIQLDKKLIIQVYTTDCIARDKPYKLKCHYYNDGIIYFPWATDLLPNKIDENISKLNNDNKSNVVNFVGMKTEPWIILETILKKRKIKFVSSGGTFNKNSKHNKSFEENMKLIKESLISPALQTDWQVEHGYIPCRIFKNISYGKMGMTNSKHVNELFDNKLIYNNNIQELVKQGIEFENNPNKNVILKSLMERVRDEHTYINRIEFIQWYLQEFMKIELKPINLI